MKATTGLAAAAVAAVLLTGCGTPSTPAASKSTGSVTTPAASPSATTPPAASETAAAAKTAASTYFALYSAGQYAAVYPMIDPTDRAAIPESVWVGIHDQCKPGAAGLTYAVTHPVLAGTVAVVTVSLAGAASALASEQASFTYVNGQWYYQPSNMQLYRGHDLTQAVAAAKAAGEC